MFFAVFSLLISSLLNSPDIDGWVSVERPPTSIPFEHVGEEDDSSIWVLFSKKVGEESFMARFPEDPQSNYLSPGEVEVTAAKEGALHRLTVLEGSQETLVQKAGEIASRSDILLVEAVRTSPDTFDCLYQSEGKWVWTHLHATPHHLYILETQSDTLQGDNHHYFVSSLKF